jgi:exoribonuclease R
VPQPRVRAVTDQLAAGFAAIRAEQHVPAAFPPDAVAEARRLAETGPPATDRADRRDLPLSSLDPAGSRDLDQAFHLERRGSGHRLHYAIADVGGWVAPGAAVDAEAHARGITIYCPDERVPLHPVELSEGAASLLPDGDRPAVLWTIDLDQRGEIAAVHVERAVVRNRRALDYAGAQTHLDHGGTDEQLRLLAEVGEARLAGERDRGGVSLTLPEQVVERQGDRYELRFDTTSDVERWNAQLSLATGLAAASLMVEHRAGVLRTLPPATPETLASLRSASIALGVAWPEGTTYPDWVRSLDPARPRDAAMMVAASRTLRGAGYVAFDGSPDAGPAGEVPVHAAIAAPYAHVTAPLRRLVDRFGTECVLSGVAGRRPPSWVLDALPTLADEMERAAARAGAVDRACIDLVEAAVLAHREGELLVAAVTSLRKDGEAVVQIAEPAVIAVATAPAGTRPGDAVRVRVVRADPADRSLRLEVVGPVTPT